MLGELHFVQVMRGSEASAVSPYASEVSSSNALGLERSDRNPDGFRNTLTFSPLSIPIVSCEPLNYNGAGITHGIHHKQHVSW